MSANRVIHRVVGCGLVWLAGLVSVHAQWQEQRGLPPTTDASPLPGGTNTPPADGSDTNAAGIDLLKEHLASPRATMRTFLEAMNRLTQDPEAEKQALVCLTLEGTDIRDAPDKIRMLYWTLNRIEYVDVDRLPDEEAVRHERRQSFVYFPNTAVFDHAEVLDRLEDATQRRIPNGRISLARGGDGLWRFDRQTVQGIDALYKHMEALEPVVHIKGDWIPQLFPQPLREGELFDVDYWQWASLLVLIFVGLLLDGLIRFVLRILSSRAIRKAGREADPEVLQRSVRPFGLLGATMFWHATLPLLSIGGAPGWLLWATVRALNGVAIAISAWRTVDLLAEYLTARASRTKTRMDDVLIPLVRKTLKIFIVAFGLIYVADAFNVPTTPLLGMLTALSLGFSFAAKDTVENFFGSVSVLFDRPFDVGDWVVVGDIEGIVEEVGFRSTRIRTFYNSQVTMPNANLVRATVDNYGRRTYRRWKTTVSLTYDTPADKLVAFTEGIRELVRKHPYTRKDYFQVWLNEFGAHSLDVLLYVFHEVPDWQTELRERERLFLDIIRLAEHLGVAFAFPTQTIHLKQGEPEPTPGPGHIPNRFTDRRAKVGGIRAARDVVANQDWITTKPPPYTFDGQDPELAYDAAGNPIAPEADDETEGPGNEKAAPPDPSRTVGREGGIRGGASELPD